MYPAVVFRRENDIGNDILHIPESEHEIVVGGYADFEGISQVKIILDCFGAFRVYKDPPFPSERLRQIKRLGGVFAAQPAMPFKQGGSVIRKP